MVPPRPTPPHLVCPVGYSGCTTFYASLLPPPVPHKPPLYAGWGSGTPALPCSMPTRCCRRCVHMCCTSCPCRLGGCSRQFALPLSTAQLPGGKGASRCARLLQGSGNVMGYGILGHRPSTARHAAPSPPDHSTACRPCMHGHQTRCAAALLTISTLSPAHPQPSKACHRQQLSQPAAHHRQAPPPWPPPCAPPPTASPAARPPVSHSASVSTVWRLEPQRGAPIQRGCRHTPLPDEFAAAAPSPQAGRRLKSPGSRRSPPRCSPRWAAARRRRRSCLSPAAGAAPLCRPPAGRASIASAAVICS